MGNMWMVIFWEVSQQKIQIERGMKVWQQESAALNVRTNRAHLKHGSHKHGQVDKAHWVNMYLSASSENKLSEVFGLKYLLSKYISAILFFRNQLASIKEDIKALLGSDLKEGNLASPLIIYLMETLPGNPLVNYTGPLGHSILSHLPCWMIIPAHYELANCTIRLSFVGSCATNQAHRQSALNCCLYLHHYTSCICSSIQFVFVSLYNLFLYHLRYNI